MIMSYSYPNPRKKIKSIMKDKRHDERFEVVSECEFLNYEKQCLLEEEIYSKRMIILTARKGVIL